MNSQLALLSEETVAVADQAHVHLHHPRTLKKARSLKPSDFPVVSLISLPRKRALVVTNEGQMVTYARSEGWRQENVELIQFPSTGSSTSGRKSRGGKDEKKVVSAHLFLVSSSNTGSTHSADVSKAGQYLAVTTADGGVYRVDLKTGVASLILEVHASVMDGAAVAVGIHSGMLVLGQTGTKIFHYVSMLYGLPSAGSSISTKKAVLKSVNLQVAVETLAAHPTEEGCVAVGGTRGEMVIFSGDGLTTGRHFSDHWHHTPLVALQFTPDGTTLLSAAGESLILSWSLQTFTYTKLVSCSVGPIHCLVGDPWSGAKVLASAAESTLALVNVVQRRVDQSVNGIHWSSKHPCKGLVKSTWKGQQCVLLTGLPDVVRFYDPSQQLTMHSIHVSHNMEQMVSSAPEAGIQHVALWDQSRIVATYESFSSSAVPTALRWWVYEEKRKRHVERQCILQPHKEDIISLKSASFKKNVLETSSSSNNTLNAFDTMFSLSPTQVKCWAPRRLAGEIAEDGLSDDDDAEGEDEELRHTFTKFSAVSSFDLPSSTSLPATAMELNSNGSLLFLATDGIMVLSVKEAHKIGNKWPVVFNFVQNLNQAPLKSIALSEDRGTIAGLGSSHAFFWSCATGELLSSIQASGRKTTGFSAISTTTNGDFLIAGDEKMTIVDGSTGKAKGSATTPMPVQHMQLLSSMSETHFQCAVVSQNRGLEVLNIDLSAKKAVKDEVKRGSNDVALDGSDLKAPTLASLFPGSSREDAKFGGAAGSSERDEDSLFKQQEAVAKENDKLMEIKGQREASHFLNDVLRSEAYAAPPMNALLDSYLGKLRQSE